MQYKEELSSLNQDVIFQNKAVNQELFESIRELMLPEQSQNWKISFFFFFNMYRYAFLLQADVRFLETEILQKNSCFSSCFAGKITNTGEIWCV